MTDSGRFSALVFAAACLAVLSVVYGTMLEPYVSVLAETARRREHYEKAVTEKGLSLHQGMYWKEKQ